MGAGYGRERGGVAVSGKQHQVAGMHVPAALPGTTRLPHCAWPSAHPPSHAPLSHRPQRLRKEMKKAIDEAVEERILNALLGDAADADTRSRFRMLYR